MAGPIVVIGSSNVDFIMKMDRLPRLGETVTGAVFMQTFGGKGANQAVGAAEAGGNVYFVNCVGDDLYGAMICEKLRAAGVNIDFVWVEREVASGAALVMVDAEGENYLSVAPGANYRLTVDRIDTIRHLLLDSAMIVLQYEIPSDTLAYTIRSAFHLGRKIMLNLTPARPIDATLLQYLYALVVNRNEAECLLGYPVDSPVKVQAAARDLRARGPLYSIITLGAQGAFISGPDLDALIPAFPVKAVDTTAAGDVYCGCLAVALVEGQSMAEAARFASAAVAISVTRLGAQPSAPARDEIEALLKAYS